MKRIKSVFAVIIALTVFMNANINTYAQSISDLQKKQNEIKDQANKAKSNLGNIQSEKKTAEAEVDAIDAELETATNDLLFVQDQLEQTQLLLERTEEELAVAQKESNEQYEILKQRLKYMYENGKWGYLDVIFESKSFSDFINRVEYINRIAEYDQGLVEKLNSIEAVIEQKRNDIVKQKEEIEVLVYQQQIKQQDLQEKLNKKQALVLKLQNEAVSAQQLIDSLDKTSKELESTIKAAQAKAAAEAAAKAKAAANAANKSAKASTSTKVSPYTGKMQWPVSGRYDTSDVYRNRINPVTGRRELHTGVDIPCATGTNIVAADSGTVILSRRNGGYGNTVIIDHGGGYSTLYGHNSKLVVSVGQSVKKGQVIAKAGSTGISTGPHCHFEVRINGSPVNPKSYLGY